MTEPKYRVALLEPARRDVERRFAYIRRRSRLGALAWYDAFLQAANRLKSDPMAAGLAPENEHVDEEIRQVFFKTRHGRLYRILFTITGNQVRVLRIRGMGEDLLGREALSD